jgi:hypothetical protein
MDIISQANLTKDGFRFNLADKIFFLKENKIVSSKVNARMRVDAQPEYSRDYESREAAKAFGLSRIQYSTLEGFVEEKDAFLTKEELLASL